MLISEPTSKMLGLSMLRGIGPAALHQIAEIPNFAAKDVRELADCLPKLRKAFESEGAWSLAQEKAFYQIREAERFESRIISVLDDYYPSLLRATKDAPYIIYTKGAFHREQMKSVAIIGTREPTSHGSIIAERVTSFFADNGWSVVSGLALGCDGIAHRQAVARGGHTVAVLAHGLQTVSPSTHRRLAEDILNSGGALISEYGFGSSALPSNFVKRDRTQAGLAQGVVMIQSDLKGGSLHASRASIQYGRWLAVPYPTQRDRDAAESKIQANLLLASQDQGGIANLLKCSTNDLERLHVIYGREDYPKIINLPVLPPQPAERLIDEQLF
jgi:DNA processing protein